MAQLTANLFAFRVTNNKLSGTVPEALCATALAPRLPQETSSLDHVLVLT